MAKSKNTRSALLCSVLATVLCAAMLIGTTFAWFTDSVTSGKNQIAAGNLDVKLEYSKDGGESWNEVTADTNLFAEGALWEPGHTEYVQLRISNVGSLALKYDFALEVYGDAEGLTEEKAFTNAEGGTAYLSDYLVFNKAAADVDTSKRENLWIADEAAEKAAMGEKALSAFAQSEAKLAVGAQESFTLAVYMPTWVGNEANYRGAEAPEIYLGLDLFATQAVEESDSFDNQYDANAPYIPVTSSDASSLRDVLSASGTSAEVTVPETISGVSGTLDVTGDIILNMGDSMIYNITPAAGTPISVAEGGSLTIHAETLKGLNYTAGKLTVAGKDSSLTVNGGNYGNSGANGAEVMAEDGAVVTLNEGRFSSSGAGGSAVKATSGSTIYINGGSYSSSGAGSTVIFADGGTIIVDNCDGITANGKQFGAANGGEIRISKTYSPSQPTSIASGCTVTDAGDYWVVSAQ